MGKKKEQQNGKLKGDMEALENLGSAKKGKKRKRAKEPTDVGDDHSKSSKKTSNKRKKSDETSTIPEKDKAMGTNSDNTEYDVGRKACTAKTFPLASGICIPTRAQLKSLSSQEQNSCFSALGTTCERILRLIDDTEAATTLWRENKKDTRDAGEASLALEDTLLADMARLKGVPVARHFAEMSMWKRLKKFNDKELACIAALRGAAEENSEEPEGGGHTETEKTGTEKQTAEFLSFKAAHMKHLTTAYAHELDKVREAESLDVAGVETLLRCLDEGAELYARAMTYKKG